jgi:hypothetical protein
MDFSRSKNKAQKLCDGRCRNADHNHQTSAAGSCIMMMMTQGAERPTAGSGPRRICLIKKNQFVQQGLNTPNSSVPHSSSALPALHPYRLSLGVPPGLGWDTMDSQWAHWGVVGSGWGEGGSPWGTRPTRLQQGFNILNMPAPARVSSFLLQR